MGGVSESGICLRSGYAVFSGNVSTDNSGGFASVRTRNFEPSLNLGNYRGIELRVKGDGQRYKLFVRTETKWDGVGYAHSFQVNDRASSSSDDLLINSFAKSCQLLTILDET